MLDLDKTRPAAVPVDAATIVLVRDGDSGLEVFCVERNKKSRFVGGAVVFPGGKVDASDRSAAWLEHACAPRAGRGTFAPDDASLRAYAIAAARETLEEAAILHVKNGLVDDARVRALREELGTRPDALLPLLVREGFVLDLSALHPFARWTTPEAEARRYDTRFYLAVAPPGQTGAHDAHETMASFWAAPREVLRRFDAGEVQLVPPTHRTLELLGSCARTDDAVALADGANLEPICPVLVSQRDASGEAPALALPGDPAHPVAETRVPGLSRYVLRGERWIPESAPR